MTEWQLGDRAMVLWDEDTDEWRTGVICAEDRDGAMPGRYRVADVEGDVDDARWSTWVDPEHMRRPQSLADEIRAAMERLAERVTALEAGRGEVTLTEHVGRVMGLRVRLAEVEAERDVVRRAWDDERAKRSRVFLTIADAIGANEPLDVEDAARQIVRRLHDAERKLAEVEADWDEALRARTIERDAARLRASENAAHAQKLENALAAIKDALARQP